MRRLFGKRLSGRDYQVLRQGAEVIEHDGDGDKVLRLADGSFLKLFMVKSRFSSARLLPYSVRFATNADKLHRMNIPTVTIINCYRIPSIARTAVHYQPLPGKTLRQVLSGLNSEERQKLLADNARLIARMHRLGVYFRSAHLGNIVQQPDGTLGLIDIADMRFSCGTLKKELRLRNFRHMARYEVDVNYLLENNTFPSVYAEQASMNAEDVARVIQSSRGQ
ncbi:hypothetical protein EZMO1_3964 [Endozoicomonas montiporae CL-33]|uniref:Toluene tolerance protein n=2 Tax=Endozoicomonas montiporae TaxID=1027273 RepID=A0A142BGM8_9GAMM|nr:hypothetical protein EZMO1_3964 [Endozoicomonas montiporae CL-33]